MTLNVLHKPCTYKLNSHVMIVLIIQEQSLDYNPLQVLYYSQMPASTNSVDLQTQLSMVSFKGHWEHGNSW